MEISSCCLADYCTSNKFFIKVHAMHAAQLFSPQPVRSLFSGIVFAIAIVLGKTPYSNNWGHRNSTCKYTATGFPLSACNQLNDRLLQVLVDNPPSDGVMIKSLVGENLKLQTSVMSGDAWRPATPAAMKPPSGALDNVGSMRRRRRLQVLSCLLFQEIKECEKGTRLRSCLLSHPRCLLQKFNENPTARKN